MNCLACGFVMPTPLRFCGGCGARLGVDRVGETTRERNYTPAHLAKRILQTRSALEGERKHVTVLFCDIADSTPLASRIGSDRMHKLLNAFFEAASTPRPNARIESSRCLAKMLSRSWTRYL